MTVLIPALMLLTSARLQKEDEKIIDPNKTLVYVFDIRDEIGKPSWRVMREAFSEAADLKADFILLHLNTYGGLVNIADSMRTRILNSPIPVLAFIDNQAISAGALISIACDSIYIRSGGSIGAATVVDQTGSVVPDKYQSFMRSTMRSTAESHGKDTIITGTDTVIKWRRDPRIAEAMVDPTIVAEGIDDSTKVLTFTVEEAIANGYCEGMANNITEVLQIAGIRDYQLVTYKPSGVDKIIGFLLSTVVQGILIMIMLGGIYFEMQAPGIGFPLIAALAAALLYFAPLYLEGLAEHWEILLFIAGVGLIIVELFVIPGFGVAGISGIVLIKYRVQVEVEYFIALCELPLKQLSDFRPTDYEMLRGIYRIFSMADAIKIKESEKTTNHDVKAVEYFLKNRFDEMNLGKYKEFIHFGLTSQDINNTAVPLTLKLALHDVYLPVLHKVTARLEEMAQEWKDVPMLARTHGQPASPTRLGKEIQVFVERLKTQTNQLLSVPFSAKFGGATGNFNAHKAAYPGTDWVEFANHFVNDTLGLSRLQTTTQIEHYDNMGAMFDCMKRINTILIDLDRDFWTYISMEYFKQRIKEGEVGSSVMPHKVNPIDFENSEGNLGMANAIFEFLSAKLPVSRLQRDLTDSTVLRNIGVPFAHTIIALKALQKGLDKVILNKQALDSDLEDNWIVISEAMQTILRREGYPKPYEALKGLTRTNRQLTKEDLHQFIDELQVTDDVKEELKSLSPFNYTGI